MRILSILIPIFLFFTSCEEVAEVTARKGSGSTNEAPVTTDEVLTDAWDLPFSISGITYTTPDGTQATTTANGQITCTDGETLVFSIGSVVIGSADCSDNITLEDIAGVDDSTDDEAVQLTLLLLSLDDDDDPNNGINIVSTATDYTGTTTLDLTDPTAVADLIQEVDPGTPVIPTTEIDDIIEESEATENAATVLSSIWDLPIEGLTYSTPSGGVQTTGASGLIFCVEGETVTFSIGDLEIADLPCSEDMTLADLAGTTDSTDSEAIQLALILLSLDEDGNPDNGIQITNSATEYTGVTTLDLTDPVAVATLIQELNPGTSVIPVEDVIDTVKVVTGKSRGKAVAYNGSITTATDLTGGECPSGASSLNISKNDEVSLTIPSNSNTPIDISQFLANGVIEVDEVTGLAEVIFNVPDSEAEMNILDCSANGGYLNLIKVRMTDIPMEIDPDSVISSYEIYQICGDATELAFCEGTFSGSK